MSIAAITGRALGVVAAEVQYYVEKGITPIATASLAAQTVKVTYDLAKNIAKDHKIDSSDPAVVTRNLYECLEYLDQ